MSEKILQPKVISVRDLLRTNLLCIPDYQRPYKWTEVNVNQLIDDIRDNLDKSAYRIGTIVIHHNKPSSDEQDKKASLDIVDGQQRTITLFLLAYFACEALEKDKDLRNHVLKRDDNLKDYLPVSELSFKNPVSRHNIQKNAATIRSRNSDILDAKFLDFFFNKCELVWVQIDSVSEAFQFFDSQNARGKDLEPHDLLKAYHLREMNCSSTEDERTQVVKNWEDMDTSNLSDLFSQYLYRIRNWGRNRSARYFTKADVGVFKGISPSLNEEFPYTKMLRIANYYIGEFNSSCHSQILQQHLDFPFQIDQVVINGKRFFEYVSFYSRMVDRIKEQNDSAILSLVKTHQSHGRTGDGYVRNLFYCALIYFVDKFGDKYLDKAAAKFFVWAYTLRLKLYSVGIDSTDNYALAWNHTAIPMFKIIRDAITPQDVLNVELERFIESKATKVDDILTQVKLLWGENV